MVRHRRSGWRAIAGRTREELALALKDPDPGVRSQAVVELGGILPMYELVQDEQAELFIRRAVAEELVTLGLLRRRRVGPSRMFLWLVAATLVIVSAAAATSIGIATIALLPAGGIALIVYSRKASSRERESGTYIGPDGATIQL